MTSDSTSGYAITRDLDAGYADVVARIRTALAGEGFGILTEIDVAATLKAKLDRDVPPYVILGACNPALAAEGLDTEPDLGVLLPCNVVVRDTGHGTRVAAMEPLAAMALAGNPALAPLAEEARRRLERALATL